MSGLQRITVWLKSPMTWAVLLCCASGLLAVVLGKDINWNLRNNHYYNAHALVHQRLSVDVVPAQLQTFHNPLLDLPFYVMVQGLPSWLVGFLLGFVQCINLILVYLIFRSLTAPQGRWQTILGATALVFMSAMAPGFLAELGTTLNDNMVSLFVLGALVLLVPLLKEDSRTSAKPPRRAALAGMVLGLGVGLKLTLVVYAMGLFLALAMHALVWQQRAWRLLLLYLMGCLVGILLTGGYWAGWLYATYGNPLMPYYNDLFQSPAVRAMDFVDRRFLPRRAWEYLVWPVILTFKSSRVSEMRFVDIRFLVLYCGYLLWGIRGLRQWGRGKKEGTRQVLSSNRFFDLDQSRFLLIFMGLTFILWMFQSSIYRYLMALELLAPLGILILVHRLWHSPDTRAWVVGVTAVIALHVIYPTDWGRVEWGHTYFSEASPPLELPDDSVVIMLGGGPFSYVIPRFPETTRFLRPQGNLGLTERDGLMQRIRSVLESHTGRRFVLYEQHDGGDIVAGLEALNLSPKFDTCEPLDTVTGDQLRLCHLAD